MATDNQPLPLWRRCELAWMNYLAGSGAVVVRLADAVKNAEGTAAPLIQLNSGRRPIRAPDLEAIKEGAAAFWEVKYRSRADVHPTTGAEEFWMERAAFDDYRSLERVSGVEVSIVLFHAAEPEPRKRWLTAPSSAIEEHGREEHRVGSDGKAVRAWVWPSSCMASVAPPAPPAAISPVDRLESLRLALGIPLHPTYSVVRIGPNDDNLLLSLRLLDFGIRLFVVTNVSLEDLELPDGESSRDRLNAFGRAGMLEWSVVGDLEGDEVWAVDGHIPEPEEGRVARVLNEADRTGGINLGQFKVVHADPDADVLVTAGAGTGKTETMCERLLFLLATDNGVRSPAHDGAEDSRLRLDDTVFMTFTREAAAEMRRRIVRSLLLRRRLSPDCVMPITDWLLQLSSTDVETIHGYARKVLQRDGASIGISPDFRVTALGRRFDDWVYSALSDPLEELYEQGVGWPEAYKFLKFVRQVWKRLASKGLSPLSLNEGDEGVWGRSFSAGQVDVEALWGVMPDDENSEDWKLAHMVRLVIEKTAKRFRRQVLDEQAIPLDELIRPAGATLRAVGPQEERPRYIFIDEFQDTDAEQMDFLVSLRGGASTRLFIVGDEKQGIYRFRGAQGDAFTELRARFGLLGRRLEEFGLTKNFRSGRALLDALHKQFLHWGDDKHWKGKRFLHYGADDRLRDGGLGAPIGVGKVVANSSPRKTRVRYLQPELCTEAVQHVARWRHDFSEDSIAVLGRTNSEARSYRDQLVLAGIPCSLRVGGDFFRTSAIIELRVLLEAVADPSDDAALLELAETGWFPGLMGAKWAGALLSWESRFASMAATGVLDRSDLKEVRARVEALGKQLDAAPTLGWLIDCAARLQPSRHSGGDAASYERCLSHAFVLLDNVFGGSPISVIQVLEWVREQIAHNDQEDEPQPATDSSGLVTALTVHSVKGLEFDRVLIPKTDRPFEPSDQSRSDGEVAVVVEGATPRVIWRWLPFLSGRTLGREYANASTPQLDRLWALERAELAGEETRLLYVAMTRARKECLALVPKGFPQQNPPECWADLL